MEKSCPRCGQTTLEKHTEEPEAPWVCANCGHVEHG